MDEIEEIKWLEPADVQKMSGEEEFSGLGLKVKDYWSWAYSDLRSNVVRGVLAEYLVAKAVGSEQAVRDPWDDFDVLSPEGIKIEVKSSAYLQSWATKEHSKIVFNGLTGRKWDAKDGLADVRTIRADVFVFCIQTCKDHESYDPLDMAQWEFHVIDAATIQLAGTRSVSLAFLTKHDSVVLKWQNLADAVRSSYETQLKMVEQMSSNPPVG